MKKRNKPSPREVHWCIKLHLDTVAELGSSTKDKHKTYSVEGKERPVILLNIADERFGKVEFLGAFTTTQGLNGRGESRKDIIDFEPTDDGRKSYIEVPPERISEQLLTRRKDKLSKLAFLEIKRQINKKLMQQIRS